MINVLLAIAGLALPVPVQAQAAVPTHAPATKHVQAKRVQRPKPKPSKPKIAEADAVVQSAATLRVADWIAASGDNGPLPYIIIDKPNAALFLFDAKGNLLGTAPVLIGVALGDEATPGIGSKNLAEIGPAEKTTPAGRFLAKFGRAAGKQKVLWVDYATSVALHAIPPGASKKEHRRERMLSPTSDDNRITFGCINVPDSFYSKSVAPRFRKKGGYVYILPDTTPIETVFPSLLAQPQQMATRPEGAEPVAQADSAPMANP